MMLDVLGKEVKVNDKVITFEIVLGDTVLETGTIVKIEKCDDGCYYAEIMISFLIGNEDYHRYVWRKSKGIMKL